MTTSRPTLPDSARAEPFPAACPRPGAGAPSSVLHALNEHAKRLEMLLRGLRTASDAGQTGMALARDLAATVERAPDIALAAILLNQIAGLYVVRHCVETAIVVALVWPAPAAAPASLHSVVAAALTMNAGMLDQRGSYQGDTLSGAERDALRRHSLESADLLRAAGVADPAWLACVLMHHENDDGSGYPAGAARAAVPREARLIALADRYCAYVSARNYRRSLLAHEALRKLREDHPGAGDAALVALFEARLGATPPGTLVRLDGGALAVVARRADAA
ncbi:HD-GYP domain-containing protein, partial [Massilia glaciei]